MRTELERRPLLVACLGLIVGIGCVRDPTLLVFALVLAVAVRTHALRLLAAMAILLGVLLAPDPGATPETLPWTGSIQAKVCTVPRLTAVGQMCEIQQGSWTYLLICDGAPALALGDTVRISGRFGPMREGSERYWMLRGVRGTVRSEAGGVEVLSRGSMIAVWASQWRQAFLEHTESSLSIRASHAVDALCFNVDGRLDASLRENLQRTGTTHIVSASGLHTLILAAALLFFLSLLPIPRWVQLIVLCMLLAMYALSTGLRPPIVRAVIMAATFAFAYVFRREPDLLSALAFAAGAYLLVEPDSLFDIGFQLSFLTVAAFGLYLQPLPGPRTTAMSVAKARARDVARASLVATAASGPVVAYHFGVFSLISVVANVLIAAVLAPIVVLSFASLAIKPLSEAISVGMMQAFVGPLAGWILWVSDTLGPLPISAVSVPEFSPYLLVPIYGAFLMLWRRGARPA